MEYEIECEAVLFDPSTNPSLEHVPGPPPATGEGTPQRAVPIPDEDSLAT